MVVASVGMNFIETLANWSAMPARTLATPVQKTNLLIPYPCSCERRPPIVGRSEFAAAKFRIAFDCVHCPDQHIEVNPVYALALTICGVCWHVCVPSALWL